MARLDSLTIENLNLRDNISQLSELITQKAEEAALQIQEMDLELDCLRAERDTALNNVARLTDSLERLKTSIEDQYVPKSLYVELSQSKNKIIEGYKAALDDFQSKEAVLPNVAELAEQTRTRFAQSKQKGFPQNS